MTVFKTLILSFFITLIQYYAVAQVNIKDNKWKTYPPENDTIIDNTIVEDTITIGKIQIIGDERIDKLLEKHISINEEKEKILGFRVQLYSGLGNNSRKEAQEVKAEFLKKHPETLAYTPWEKPNFKVKIGNFRTRLEALKFHSKIVNDFPNAFIVKEEIDFPKLD